jgi:hypothetical protein
MESTKIARIRGEVYKRLEVRAKPLNKTPTWTINKSSLRKDNQIETAGIKTEQENYNETSSEEEIKEVAETSFQIDFDRILFESSKDEYPIIRDLKKNLEPLERYFGCLSTGDLFGETCMIAPTSKMLLPTVKFYDAFAITDCYYLTLKQSDLKKVWQEAEQRKLKEH